MYLKIKKQYIQELPIHTKNRIYILQQYNRYSTTNFT